MFPGRGLRHHLGTFESSDGLVLLLLIIQRLQDRIWLLAQQDNVDPKSETVAMWAIYLGNLDMLINPKPRQLWR